MKYIILEKKTGKPLLFPTGIYETKPDHLTFNSREKAEEFIFFHDKMDLSIGFISDDGKITNDNIASRIKKGLEEALVHARGENNLVTISVDINNDAAKKMLLFIIQERRRCSKNFFRAEKLGYDKQVVRRLASELLYLRFLYGVMSDIYRKYKGK